MTTQDTTTYDEADLAPISTASSEDQLDEAMEVARIAANAQRDIEADGGDPLDPADDEEPETPEPDEDTEEEAEDSPADEALESEDAEPEEEAEEEDEEPEPSEPPSRQPRQPQYSRRDAARFKSELDAANQNLATTRAQLQQHQTSDASIIRQIAEQAGSEQEYQQLTNKIVSGAATEQDRQRAAIMQQWRTVAGPIYRQAQLQVVQAWSTAFKAASSYEGMTPEAAEQVMSATDPQQALEVLHAAGVVAGDAAARDEMKGDMKKLQAENQRLKAELSSVKTKQVTAKPAPAAPEGNTPASMPKLPPMFLEDGVTLNPDFEKLASSGKLYGVEKLTG